MLQAMYGDGYFISSIYIRGHYCPKHLRERESVSEQSFVGRPGEYRQGREWAELRGNGELRGHGYIDIPDPTKAGWLNTI